MIPVFRDAELLKNLLLDLSSGSFGKIVVSYADESEFVDSADVVFLRTPRGRGRQIAQAIANTNTEWIWILHADVRVPKSAMAALRDALNKTEWGAFRISLAGNSKFLSTISFLMNRRSRMTSIYTGDQGMYVRRALLDRVGGYPPIELMEDVECSRRLRHIQRGPQLPVRLTVSARKWDQEGVIRTILRMWWYRLLYFFGAAPKSLANRYYH